MTPVEALSHDPEAQRLERNRQETPWFDHEQLRPGDLIAFERWAASDIGEPGMLQFYWHALHTGLLVRWRRTPSNRASEFELLLGDQVTQLRVYDSEADKIRVSRLQKRQLT